MFRKILDIFAIRRYCVNLQIWENNSIRGFISYLVWAATPDEAQRKIYNKVVKKANFVIIDYNFDVEEV